MWRVETGSRSAAMRIPRRTAQQHAEGDVAHQPPAHRRVELVAQRRGGFVDARIGAVPELHPPVALEANTARAPLQVVSRRELADAAIDGVGGGHELEGEE